VARRRLDSVLAIRDESNAFAVRGCGGTVRFALVILASGTRVASLAIAEVALKIGNFKTSPGALAENCAAFVNAISFLLWGTMEPFVGYDGCPTNPGNCSITLVYIDTCVIAVNARREWISFEASTAGAARVGRRPTIELRISGEICQLI